MADDLTRPVEDLYERDYVAWTEAQAAALRTRGAGRNALDYDNLAEEIEDLGKSETHACESQIDNIITHLLKMEFVGPAATIPHWRGELYEFRRRLDRHRTRTIDNRLKPTVENAFASAIKALVIRGTLSNSDQVSTVRDAYTWEQIVDADWYPTPRYDT